MQEDKYKEQSKKLLLDNITKKIKTTMIGAISQLEEQFAVEIQEDPEFKSKFNIIRANILSNGHKQIRAIEDELALYTVRWDRYQLHMTVKEE